MPGEIATYLLGAQGGVADDFARLHAATNPLLLRYLRVTADGDHAELARTAWVTVLPQLQVCPPDDDAWLELVVGAARTAVLAGDGAASLAPAGTATAPSGPDTDAQAQAIAALRACPPAEAEVLAMGAVANLGRAAMSRVTGLEPAAILALVLQGQQHLHVSLERLIEILRAPGTAAEVADLPFAAGLFSAGFPITLPPPTPHAAALASAATAGAATAVLAAPPTAAAAASLPHPSVVAIHSLQSSAPASAQKALGTPSRSARAGAAAAAWLLAVGGISTAAAMSGLLSVAIDGILGRDRGPLVTADGPVVPGPLPTTEPPSGSPSTGGTPTPTPTDRPPDTPPDSAGGGTVDDTVTLPRGSGALVVVASFDPSTPSTPTATPTPTPTPTEPPATPRAPVAPTPPSSPRPVVPTVNDHGKAKGKGHAKHQGKHLAKGHAKAKSHANPGKHLAQGHAKANAKAKHDKQAKATQDKQAKATQDKQTKDHGTATGHTNKGKR